MKKEKTNKSETYFGMPLLTIFMCINILLLNQPGKHFKEKERDIIKKKNLPLSNTSTTLLSVGLMAEI